MKATTLSVEDVKNLVAGRLVLQMPDFNSTVAARNQVHYVRKSKDFPKGKEISTSTKQIAEDLYEFSVSVVDSKENN